MRRIIDKGYRGARPATFIQRWARKHCPPEIAAATVRVIAIHWGVTVHAIRRWAKDGTVPKHGGYPKGLNGARQKAAVRIRERPKPAPIPEPPKVINPMPAFLAELHARAARPLVRIFRAEWPR